jgi:hypothetical protein
MRRADINHLVLELEYNRRFTIIEIMSMRYLSFLRPGILAIVVLLASCGSSDNEVTAYYVRAVHALVDGPLIQMNVSELPLHSAVDYLKATRMAIPVSKGGSTDIATIEIKAFTPAGESIIIETIPDYEFSGNVEYTVITAGTLANPTTFITSNPRRVKPVTGGYLEFIHASLDLGPLDIFLTDPGVDLIGITAYTTLSFGESSGSLGITPGEYQIRVTNSGTTDVVFDSGTANLSGDAERQMILVDNASNSSASLTMIRTLGQDSAVTGDATYGGRVRGLNINAVEGPLDILAGPAQTPIALALDYGSLDDFVVLEGGDLNFLVTPAADVSTSLLEFEGSVEAGKEYTFVTGSSPDGMIGVLGSDDRRSVSTESRIRAIHGIYTSEILNVYLSEELPVTMPPAYSAGIIRNLAYGATSNLYAGEPGEYYLSITTRPELGPTGEANLVEPILVQLNGGDNLTILIAQASATEQAPYTITLVDETLN